ncbi:MAG: hypothetical protein ACREV1_15100 [Gammaproteobacteria bacterium]
MTAILMRRQEVRGPVWASLENDNVAAAETFTCRRRQHSTVREGKDGRDRRGTWHRHGHKGSTATWETSPLPGQGSGRQAQGRPERPPMSGEESDRGEYR